MTPLAKQREDWGNSGLQDRLVYLLCLIPFLKIFLCDEEVHRVPLGWTGGDGWARLAVFRYTDREHSACIRESSRPMPDCDVPNYRANAVTTQIGAQGASCMSTLRPWECPEHHAIALPRRVTQLHCEWFAPRGSHMYPGYNHGWLETAAARCALDLHTKRPHPLSVLHSPYAHATPAL